MRYEMEFPLVPVGYSLCAKKKGDTHVTVSVRGFISSEDGDLFVKYLEGFPNDLLGPAMPRVTPSIVDHMLAIIRPDRTAVVYVNELPISLVVRHKRSLKAGEPVSRDDIADIDRLKLGGIHVPADAGVVLLFSAGWRKGVFFDFGPIQPKQGEPRSYDLEAILGQLCRQLFFHQLHKLDQDQWRVLVGAGWFPFAALRASTVEKMIAHVQNDWDVDDLLPEIGEEVRGLVPRFRERWSTNAFFSDHYDVLGAGLQRFEAGDHVSAISVLTPRVEGILRSFGLSTGSAASQAHVLTNAAVRRLQHESPDSLLFPRRFRKYLNSLHFGPFDASALRGVSRHTVAHGVAPAAAFTQKNAIRIVLILDQLSFFLRGRAPGRST